MGMDLTNYVEVRDHKTGEWKIAPVQVETVHYEAEHMDKPCCLTKIVYEYDYAQPWYGRNSELFSILEGGNYNSILSYSRGLPSDVSKEVYDFHEQFKNEDFDGYWSYGESYLTLAELSSALTDRKKYPKWIKYRDEFGSKIKEHGSYWDLKDFVDAIRYFTNLVPGVYDSNDVRVVFWFDC